MTSPSGITGKYEVRVYVNRVADCLRDDVLLAHSTMTFDTCDALVEWIEKAGVTFI